MRGLVPLTDFSTLSLPYGASLVVILLDKLVVAEHLFCSRTVCDMLSQSIAGPFTGEVLKTVDDIHDIMKFIPYNRRTLSSMRCVSKPCRSAVQNPHSPWVNEKEMMLSQMGQCVVFNAAEDADGHSSYELHSVSPVGRKFRTNSARMLSRYHNLVSTGLSKLVLHHAEIDSGCFEHLGALTNLRVLELVYCLNLTDIAGASAIKSLESLEVCFCRLQEDGANGLDLPKLKRLQICSCLKLSNLNDITPRTAASLEELHIENCSVYDDTVGTLFQNLSPLLHTLYLGSTHIDKALCLIPEKTREEGLVNLHLPDTPMRFETLQEIAPSMQKRLEFLSLENCAELESFEPVGRLQALRFLDVSVASNMDGLEFLTRCSHLELFRMANSQIEGIVFLQGNTELRVLDAPQSHLTDYTLMFLGNSPALDTVVLTACLYVTNINVLSTCPNIRRIFCSETGVSDEGISELHQCEKLEEIDLKMTSVTDIMKLVDCVSLKRVNVASTAVGKEGVSALTSRGVEVICDSTDFLTEDQ